MRLPFRGAGLLIAAPDCTGTDRILLGYRRVPPNMSKWALPGGGCSYGRSNRHREPLVDAAIRCAGESLRTPVPLEALMPEGIAQNVPEWRVRYPFYEYHVYLCRLRRIPFERWPQEELGDGKELDPIAWFQPTLLPRPLGPFARACVAYYVRIGLVGSRKAAREQQLLFPDGA